jgi:hypothetical protein
MNLELREDLLSKLNIPLVVFEGKIGKIVIKVTYIFLEFSHLASYSVQQEQLVDPHRQPPY